ncbi:MAG TPA: hypothetical protein ENN03_00805 [bacterium]|nr:hypothetical protein [bacterium]
MKPREKIQIFQKAFQFNPSVYATRFEKQGKVCYFTECENRFNAGKGCRIGKRARHCLGCPNKVRASVTDRIIREHITGQRIHAFYLLLPDGSCQTAAFDLDREHTITDVQKLAATSKEYGLYPYPATSTSKGWHIYFFLDGPIQAAPARALLYKVYEESDINPVPEIFPKQAFSNDLGNPIRLPLSEPNVQKGRCAFLAADRLDQPYGIEEQWDFLKSIHKSSAKQIGFLVDWLNLNQENNCFVKSNTNPFPKELKPCIRKTLTTGATEGKRNETGLMVVTEMRRLQNTREQIMGVMAVWNLRNRPPLSNHELVNIVDSGLSHPYSYGCRSVEIKGVLKCIGRDQCEYYQKYQRMRMNTEIHHEVKENETV